MGERATHRHVCQAQAVEHAVGGILELGEVDVLFDARGLGAELLQAARSVHVLVERDREETLCRAHGRYKRQIALGEPPKRLGTGRPTT